MVPFPPKKNTGGGEMPSRLPSGCGPPIMTFHEFRKVKEKDRQGHFKNKASKKRKVDDNTDSPMEKMVTIKVGIMAYREDTVTLKPVRGSLLAVAMSVSSNSKDVRAKAVEKLSRFNQTVSNCPSIYYLLYPDFTRVEKLPGTEEGFSLFRYKQELGKPYECITLYLCKSIDYLSNQGIFLTDSDDEEIKVCVWSIQYSEIKHFFLYIYTPVFKKVVAFVVGG